MVILIANEMRLFFEICRGFVVGMSVKSMITGCENNNSKISSCKNGARFLSMKLWSYGGAIRAIGESFYLKCGTGNAPFPVAAGA